MNEWGEYINACDNAIAEKERDGRVRKDDKRKLPSFPTLGPLVKIKTESTRKFSNFLIFSEQNPCTRII